MDTHLPTPPGSPDRALKAIVAANAATLVLALWQQWSLLQLMWPYWMQSVIIGWYARQRILKLREFSTEGLRINKRAVAPTPETQRQVASFFALHFGFFHVVYLAFLLMFSTSADSAGFVTVNHEGGGTSEVYMGHLHPLDYLAFGLLSLGFWGSHRASHREHVRADLSGCPNLGTLMFLPYARVVPMHLTIILGVVMGDAAVWLFALLKTGADVIMHKVEHRLLGGGRRPGRDSGPAAVMRD